MSQTCHYLQPVKSILALLCLLLALPLWAGEEPKAQAETQQTRQEEYQAKDQEQLQHYRRLVPPGYVPSDLESDIIKVRSARNWSLLTYPTGKLPSQPLGQSSRASQTARAGRSRVAW